MARPTDRKIVAGTVSTAKRSVTPMDCPTFGIAEHPDVVVESDELHRIGSAEVEVGEAEVKGQRHRDHREQDEPDDPW